MTCLDFKAVKPTSFNLGILALNVTAKSSLLSSFTCFSYGTCWFIYELSVYISASLNRLQTFWGQAPGAFLLYTLGA